MGLYKKLDFYVLLGKPHSSILFTGLSSYADDPKSAAKSISKLLQTAKEHIPQEQWAQTPITLKATAGKLTTLSGSGKLLELA